MDVTLENRSSARIVTTTGVTRGAAGTVAAVARAVQVERQRLLAPLVAGPVVAIGAPSGYGKTVLAEQLLERWALPTVRWTARPTAGPRVSAGDLLDGLRRGARREGLLGMSFSMTAATPAAGLDALLDFLVSTPPVAVHLDDAHLLDRDAAMLVADLAAGLPATSRLVVGHRPGKHLDALERLSVVKAVGVDEMAMDADEIALIVRHATGAEPDVGMVADLQSLTAGWPAAVALAAHRLRQQPTWNPDTRAAGPGILAGLVEAIIGDRRELYSRLAVPPLLDRRIVGLLGDTDAWDALQTDGPPMHADPPWWTFPDSVRAAIEVAVGRPAGLDDSALVAIGERYVAHGEISAVVDLAVTAERPDVLVRVLGQCHWTDLEAAGAASLTPWIGMASGVDPERAARFGVVVARALETERPDLQGPLLDELVGLAASGAVGEELARAISAEDLRRRTTPGAAREIVAAATAALRDVPQREVVTTGRLHLTAGHAASMLSTPSDKVVAAQHLRRAAELFAVAKEHRWQAAALGRLGYHVLFHKGRYREADDVLRDALSLLPAGDRSRGWWLAYHAEVLDHLGHRLDALATAREAIAIGERLRDRNVRANGHWTLAWISGHQGDLAGVREAMAAVEAARPAFLDSYSGIDFYGSMVDHLVACGDVEAARRSLERVRSHPMAGNYRAAVSMAEARWEAVVGDPRRALAILDEIGDDVGTQPNTDWVRHVERAIAAARLGDRAGARRSADAAFSVCASFGVPDLPLRLERSLVAQLDSLLDGGLDVRSADHAPEPGLPPRPADVIVLGGFAVRRGAEDVAPPPGLPTVVVQLLAVRGATNVERLIDELWPDADAATGRARLRNLLHRIRSSAGDIVERRGSSLALAEGVTVDRDLFEAAADAAYRAEDHRRPALARRAVSLYTGELLPDELYTTWITSARHRLHHRYLDLLDIVADAAERSGAIDEAISVLQQALDASPTDAERALRIVRLCRRQSRSAAAQAAAALCIAALEDLDLPVGPELRAAARSGT